MTNAIGRLTASTNDLPRVNSVTAGPNFTLSIVWQDGSRAKADLTGLIHSSQHFSTFIEDPAAFRKVKPLAWGNGVEWESGLDYSANTLKELADEQKPMKGKELSQFVAAKKLNNEEFAEMLGCTVKTVRSYFASKEVPQWVAITVRCFQRDDTIFAAHFRPVEVNPRGRPRSRV
jgi:Protein of unknown function (DUF2442)